MLTHIIGGVLDLVLADTHDMCKALQSVDWKTSFLFVGYVNAHREEWLGSFAMTVHGSAALDFASSSFC